MCVLGGRFSRSRVGIKGRLTHGISTIPLHFLERETSLGLSESDQFFTGQILREFLIKPRPPIGALEKKCQ
jgi:hypothetical protein